MQYNKIKKIILLAVILCINSVPAVVYAEDVKSNEQISGQIIVESKIEINDNWLTRQVASQLNKDVVNLTEQDFLNIKKIELKQDNIKDEIPQEIQLLKNLEYLNLHNSQIDGQVPTYIGDLPKLTYLDLGDNKFEELPDNIKQKITNRKYIYCDVEENEFTLDEGWYYLKGKWCYLDRHGERLEGNQTINQKEYKFDDDGNIKEGLEKDNNSFYYYDGLNGLLKSNWKLINDKWYYFNEDGIMQKGFQIINGVKYYLNDSGIMLTGWQYIDSKWFFFASSGGMEYGWKYIDNNWYYLDTNTGTMVTGDITIENKKYRFSSSGSLMTNIWLDEYTYVQANGYSINTYYDYAHSNTNYQLFKYMTNVDNEWSVDSTAVALHGGDTSNNCVFFSSEALRRTGVNIPTYMSNTYELENQLLGMGFVSSYDLSQLKPGDIILTNGYTHVYIFMYWDKDGYAYVVDNQGSEFDNKVLHRRQIFTDTEMTDRASHFFYYPS